MKKMALMAVTVTTMLIMAVAAVSVALFFAHGHKSIQGPSAGPRVETQGPSAQVGPRVKAQYQKEIEHAPTSLTENNDEDPIR